VVIHLVNHLNDKKPVGPLVSLKPSKQQQICGEPLKKKKIQGIAWKKLHTNQTKNVLICTHINVRNIYKHLHSMTQHQHDGFFP
jgi:hypothetical protein